MSFCADAIERKIGYTFGDKELLRRAFVHSTYANQFGGESNERLEYLGDAVLQLVVSERQYTSGGETEGEMTSARQKAVSKPALLASVRKLKISADDLLYSGSASNIGDKTLSSIFETLTAAIYLDGGYEAAKAFVLSHISVIPDENYIGKLQEWNKGRLCPIGERSEKTGPDNAPHFVVILTTSDGDETRGEGRTLREAKQAAAKEKLDRLMRKK